MWLPSRLPAARALVCVLLSACSLGCWLCEQSQGKPALHTPPAVLPWGPEHGPDPMTLWWHTAALETFHFYCSDVTTFLPGLSLREY